MNISLAYTLITFAELHYLVAMIFGLTLQVSVETALNRTWTFRARKVSYLQALVLTANVELVCFGIQATIAAVGIDILGYHFLPVRFFSVLVTGSLSFVGALLLTFSKKKRRQ